MTGKWKEALVGKKQIHGTGGRPEMMKDDRNMNAVLCV